MIITAGQITVDPAHVDEMEAALAVLTRQTKSEDGCIHYSILVSDRTTAVLDVCEIWEDEAALTTHLSQSWTQEFFANNGHAVRAMNVQIYDAANPRTLPVA